MNFSERFGVHWVNFSHPDRPRVPKKSAIELTKIFANNGFPNEDDTGDSASTKIAVGLITYVFAMVAFMFAKLF